jgi:hypothetical protein
MHLSCAPHKTCPQPGKRAGGDGVYLLPSLSKHAVDGGATEPTLGRRLVDVPAPLCRSD